MEEFGRSRILRYLYFNGLRNQRVNSSSVTTLHYSKEKPYLQLPPLDGHLQSITQCGNRRVDKGTVVTQPPSFLQQRENASVSLFDEVHMSQNTFFHFH
ncbi:hypothetical protein AVEN_170952-1 [Araneus ventricosus]|uniref:Uncharacterized protein n=1 Tax=Araneus ventricosus TaxID=182803 RepID=A0A4Y2LLK6_ARAVE|nr:hypothetical protein AVEN_170952-1 [Araneus ventricosus]